MIVTAVVVDTGPSVVHLLPHFLLLVRPETDDERQFVQRADSSQHGTLPCPHHQCMCVRVRVPAVVNDKPTEERIRKPQQGERKKIWIFSPASGEEKERTEESMIFDV